MIAEVSLLICTVIFCKILSWPLKWELSIFSRSQNSSLHLGTKILSQFSGIGYFNSVFLNLSPEMFCCQRLFTIIFRCGDILGPFFSSSAKYLEIWPRKGSVGTCDSVEILPNKSILSGKFQAASSLATSVSRWSWSGMLILSSGVLSSSEVSAYLLPCSALAPATPSSSCITLVAFALVSVLVWGLILLAGGSSLEEPGVLFRCLNISTSVSVKPVRPDLNVSAILSSFSCCLFSELNV